MSSVILVTVKRFMYSMYKNNTVYSKPVNLLEPLVNTSFMKFMIARQYPHFISFFILHKAYVASGKLEDSKSRAIKIVR